jgi:hypothetical protein
MKRHGFARWRYYDRSSATESAHHAKVLAKIDQWWTVFQGKTQALEDLFGRTAKWDLPEWMTGHLQSIHPQLMWEFGPALRGSGHRLVITPESARHLRPLAAEILERAPPVPGWEFYPYRPAESLEEAKATVEARTGGDISDVVFEPKIGDHHLVDLTFFSPRADSEGDDQANHDAFVATESLLGEERLDKWIGVLGVAPLPRRQRKSRLQPLVKLRETVDALVHRLCDQLPREPIFRWVGNAEWSGFRLEPEQKTDYPHQIDMFVGKSVDENLWLAAHSNVAFYGERFSKCGETFCYVKLDGSEGLGESKFADKSEIEDALDEVLKPGELGCHIGGGTGLRYSYIDLAVTDVNRGIAAVQARLRQGNVPRRSWILFFDDELAGEWVGIYDDTPPPLLPDLE